MRGRRTFGEIVRRLERRIANRKSGRIIHESYKLTVIQVECWPEILALYEAIVAYDESEGRDISYPEAIDALDAKAREVACE